MYWFPIECDETSSAFTSGMPPPMSVASVRAACDTENFRAVGPTSGSRSTSPSSRARCPGCRTQPQKTSVPVTTVADQQRRVVRGCAARSQTSSRVEKRELVAELPVEVRELGHHLEHDDRHHHERQRHQDRRVDQRRDRLAPDLGDHLHVADVAPQHGLERRRSSRPPSASPCTRPETGRRARRTPPRASCPTAPARRCRRAPT